MRIGILCYPSIGGSGLVATELGLNLARRGHQVHFISYSAPFKLPGFERNIHFHSVDPINYPLFNHSLYTFSLTAKILEVVEQYELDLVHAHYSIPHSLCAHLAREMSEHDFRIVTTLHGTDVTLVGQDKPLFPLNKYAIHQSDAITTVSNFQREHTLAHFGTSTPIEVIYNFIDPDVFAPKDDPCSRAALADADERIIMHVSNYREPKNPAGVIHAFARLRRVGKVRLVLVGDGPGLTEIRKLCHKLELCDYINYLGKVDNVERILPLADVVLQPSYRESFGMVALEAMACRVPVVSSDIDGIPEVVAHGETGFLAAPDDHDALAERLTTLLEDKDLRLAFGRAGRQRAVDLFHADRIVPQYLRCYERVLAGVEDPVGAPGS